jgi:hypothetical protein
LQKILASIAIIITAAMMSAVATAEDVDVPNS